MHRSALFVAVALMTVAGCQCQCTNTVTLSDGGTGAGGGSGGAGGGSGGGGGQAGGGAGGGTVFDAGDGTTTVHVGDGGFTLDGGTATGTGTGVTLDPMGHIVLSTGSTELYFMWIANDARGWVSKYDTRTGKEVARYWSVIPRDCANSAGPPCAGGNATGLQAGPDAADSYHPSRTAIDLAGDVWVANRGIQKQGSVTKIANADYACIDRNGNGTIETSRDLNGDGQISTNAADGEMIIPTDWSDPAQYDECVLFTTPVGGVPPANSPVGARALAVSAGPEGSAGDVWVGIHFENRVYKLNNRNGQIVPVNGGGATFITLGFGPYGAAVDRLQRLWIVQPGVARLALIDTGTGTLVSDTIQDTANCGAYGLAIDGKNRVWLPGWSKGAIACRYDHATQTWTKFDFSAVRNDQGKAFQWGRGIAADTAGRIYMSGWGDSAASPPAAQLIRFDAETGAVVPYGSNAFIDMTDAATNGSIGVGLDGDENAWVNNYSGNATRIDKNTGAVLHTGQQPGGLYTYSDFTGYQLRNFTAPQGTYKRDFEACATDNEWRTLTWDATVPANTTLQVFAKAANTAAELDLPSTPRFGPFTTSPTDLKAAGVPKTKFLRVEFVLRSADGRSTPVLRGFNLVWACGGGIN
ncbi:MAG: hypothetical protein AB1730_22585 [Myxococcota bacterium]